MNINLKRAFVDVNGKGRLLSGRIAARRDSGKVFVLIDNDARFDEWYEMDLVSEVD